jgi:hypothetical protein
MSFSSKPSAGVIRFVQLYVAFDAAFGFLVTMTAIPVVVAATINTAQVRLVPGAAPAS